MLTVLKKHSLYFAWLVALISLLGSLYFSEIMQLPVCYLCWWQRIFMYPLVITLGVSAYREDSQHIVYSLPFAILGSLIALYHYLLQLFPQWMPSPSCSPGTPCDVIDWQVLGFITIPLLSAVAFIAIALLLISARKHD